MILEFLLGIVIAVCYDQVRQLIKIRRKEKLLQRYKYNLIARIEKIQ